MQSVTFSGQTCQDPLHERRHALQSFQDSGIPYHPDLDKANTLTNPLGPEPARGWFLLKKSQIDLLDLNALHSVVFDDNSGNTVTAYNLVVTKEPVKTHYTYQTGLSDSCYLVEVSDQRWMCHNPNFCMSLNKLYNIYAPGFNGTDGTYTFIESSRDSSSDWTWETMVEDIWNVMDTELGTFDALPYTPTGTPMNWNFLGVSAWLALSQVLYRIGCAVRWTPYEESGAYDIVRIGAADTAYDDKVVAWESSKIHDMEFQPVVRGKVPKSVTVFHNRQTLGGGAERTTGKATSAGNYYDFPVYGGEQTAAITNTLGSTVASKTATGISHPIWDGQVAQLLLTAPSTITSNNATHIGAQDDEIADSYYKMLYGDGGNRLFRAYTGIIDFIPGSKLKSVTWRADGFHPMSTELNNHPFYYGSNGSKSVFQTVPAYDETTGQHPVDMRPQFPWSQLDTVQVIEIQNGTPSGGVYDCKVKGINTYPNYDANLEDIYAKDLAGASSLTANDFYVARLVGWYNSRPFYAFDSSKRISILTAITDLSAETTIAQADQIPFYDDDASTAKKITHLNYSKAVFAEMDQLNLGTSADVTNDFVALWDATDSAADRITLTTLFSSIGSLGALSTLALGFDYFPVVDATDGTAKKVLLSTLESAFTGKRVRVDKYTKSHTDFQSASTANAVAFGILEAKDLLLAVLMRVTTAFAGTGIATYTLSVGDNASNYDDMISDTDVTTTAEASDFSPEVPSYSAGTFVYANAQSSGANLDQSTQGSVDFYLVYLPLE